MKKMKKVLSIFTIASLLISYFVMMQTNKVFAAEEYVQYGAPSNEFEFNVSEILDVYSKNQTGGNMTLKHRYDISGKSETEAIPLSR